MGKYNYCVECGNSKHFVEERVSKEERAIDQKSAEPKIDGNIKVTCGECNALVKYKY